MEYSHTGSSSGQHEFSVDKFTAFPPQQKMCAILSRIETYAVYIVDLHLDDGAADDVEIVNLDRVYPYGNAKQFVPRNPNLIFHGLALDVCFCGIGATIYMFEGIDYRGLKLKFFGKDDDTTLLGVYSFQLSAEYLTMPPPKSIPCLSKTQLNMAYEMQGRKCAPEAVQYDTSKILVFSTEIEYFSDLANFIANPNPLVDFELYNTESNDSVKLPPLHVGRLNATTFMLVDIVRNRILYFTPKYNVEWYPHSVEWRPSFLIRAFAFIRDHTFVVEADFGGVKFCLDLASEEHKWELCEVPMLFSHNYQHLITRNNLILSSYGACKVGYESCDALFPFPLCSYVSLRGVDSRNSSIALLEHTTYPEYVACIVQVGLDDYEMPFWTMDVLKLNDCKFEDRNDDDGQFAKRIKSFKFVTHATFETATIVALFPF